MPDGDRPAARRAVAAAGCGLRVGEGAWTSPVHHRRRTGLFAFANRAIDPFAKLAAAEWVTNDVAITGLEAMDEDQAYRAMDLLVDADGDAEVQEAVFFAVADLLNLEVDLLLFDTTSTYFERDTEEEGDDSFRSTGTRRTPSDLPQIVIGLAVTREGIPVRCRCWPGNTTTPDAAARGQRRPAGLAARESRDRHRPRLLSDPTSTTPPRRRPLDRRRADALRVPVEQALSRQAATPRCATTCGSKRSASTGTRPPVDDLPQPVRGPGEGPTRPRPNESPRARPDRGHPHERHQDPATTKAQRGPQRAPLPAGRSPT